MKTIVILGMHRSTTSLVARTLNREVHMGNHLLVGCKDNPKGHYENVDILRLNDKILKDAGGGWCNPPPKEQILESAKKYEDDMKRIVECEISTAREKNMVSWGFKDPRTVLTIEAWYPHLPSPQFVVCYRTPMDVAKSLHERNGFTIEDGLKLTSEYNNRINDFINNFLNR
jgi:hypothetical protein